jgi:hypothetical protein
MTLSAQEFSTNIKISCFKSILFHNLWLLTFFFFSSNKNFHFHAWSKHWKFKWKIIMFWHLLLYALIRNVTRENKFEILFTTRKVLSSQEFLRFLHNKSSLLFRPIETNNVRESSRLNSRVWQFSINGWKSFKSLMNEFFNLPASCH